MERLKTLPVGLRVQNTNGYNYILMAQSEEDTLLRRDEGYTKYVVAWNLLTDDEHNAEEFIKQAYYVPPFVSWGQGHYFKDEDKAVEFMQKRHMELTGAKMCYPSDGFGNDRCLACQYLDDCFNDESDGEIVPTYEESMNLQAEGFRC